jgi:LL-diaminopimelate aminotransferase
LCFPNNPTGACASRAQLTEWVDYAKSNNALILFDAAYEAFIRDDTPHSIYEVPGAHEVAVEFRSLSKTAGFTGTRLAYTIVPRAIEIPDAHGNRHRLWDLWNRRQSTKFNGVSFPVQRAAEAVFTPAGQTEVREETDYYLENAREIRQTIESLGYGCTGGVNSPYVWVEAKGNSWELFDVFLERTGVVITPGAGFGTRGEGFVRISAFNDKAKVQTALSRISDELATVGAR